MHYLQCTAYTRRYTLCVNTCTFNDIVWRLLSHRCTAPLCHRVSYCYYIHTNIICDRVVEWALSVRPPCAACLLNGYMCLYEDDGASNTEYGGFICNRLFFARCCCSLPLAVARKKWFEWRKKQHTQHYHYDNFFIILFGLWIFVVVGWNGKCNNNTPQTSIHLYGSMVG